MSAALKSGQEVVVKHPARPTGQKLDIAAMVRRNAAKYPRIMAKLAE